MGSVAQFSLLFVCWLCALVSLVMFLEGWFALSERTCPPAGRASGAYGVISVFVTLRGPAERIHCALRSIFEQSYPFIELFLLFYEDDRAHQGLARHFQGMRSHIAVRPVPTAFPLESEADRVRALEQARAQARGSWMVLLDAGVVLDRYALESALEFAGTEDLSALELRPGIRCRSFLHRLLAPALEWLSRMIAVLGRRSDPQKVTGGASFLLMNRDAHEVVNHINRIPGILNEAGWNLWSYKAEGLKTFEGDASGWMWRDASVAPWVFDLQTESLRAGHAVAFVAGSALISLLVVAGMVVGLAVELDGFLAKSVLVFSSLSYGLLAANYLLYARRLRAATWFSPLCFLAYWGASILILSGLRRSIRTRRRQLAHREITAQRR